MLNGTKYIEIYSSLVDEISKNPGISIEDLFERSIHNNEIIHECLEHMLSKNFIEMVETNKKFQKIRIKLVHKPELNVIEKNDYKYPKLLVTLPPFNSFGLKSELQHSNIIYSDLKSEFNKLFQKSSESIYICSPFIEFEGIKPFLPLLISKSKRGVEIKLVSREINGSNSKFWNIKKIYDSFNKKNANIEIRDYHYTSKNKIDSSIHAKLIVSDNNYAYIGSGELRKNSYEKNFEVGTVLRGKNAADIGLIFKKVFSVSKNIKFD